ncbi:NACHT domain-containing protein [Mycoavidus sp. B2-EB]|uniref:NACHT domain-containing protein n=1 Tax=Mycoavidus sp. B2-EB TaxID=2651972 RepID=UPI001625D67C|nr:NACHT domain-containing protein [Mycoavidus sp. B2-EB]BBO59892.1 hypothetical protein MPB2EB_1022 [Mycoavidus sp. B2-EB]
MSPINPDQSTRSSFVPFLSNTQALTDDSCESRVQIANGPMSNAIMGNNNTTNHHIYLTSSNPKFEETLIQAFETSQTTQKEALQSIPEPLALLGENIKDFKKEYERSLKGRGEWDVLSMYVPIQGIKKGRQGEEKVDLEAELERFFASEATVFLLQGVAGTGKSTFNRHLALKKLEDYQRLSQTQSDPPLVFFIELRSIKNPNEKIIEQFLQGKGFASEQIEALRTHSHQRCIFIFDGYDEIKERNRNFYDLNELWRWEKTKFVITSRPEYLDANYQTYFHPKGARDELREVWMAPFSAEQRSHYIQNYVNTSNPPWTVEQYEQALSKLTTLSKELERPIVLRLLLQVLPGLGKMNQNQKALTLGAVYEHYFQKWWGNWQSRLGAIELTRKEEEAKEELCERKGGFIQQGFAYIQNCAVELTQASLISVQDSEGFKNRYQSVYEAFFADETKIEERAQKRLLRFNAPFQIKQKQHYEFSHKSMQEYLVARAICAPDFEAIELHPEDVLNQLSLVKEPVILDFLVERVKEQPQFKAHLYAWIEASKDPRAFVTVGAANAITIFVRAGVQFIEADLKGIRIPGADLSNGVFDSARLQGSDFRAVNFRQAWLRGANLSKAQMAGVKFGEWPTLKEKSAVYSCAYLPDGKACAVGFLDGKICVYDTSSWANIHTLRGHESFVKSLAYSPNGMQLASGGNDNTVRLWDAQKGRPGPILHGHTGNVNSVAYSPNGTQLASGSNDGTARLWDVEKGESSLILSGHAVCVNSVTYSPNGLQLASGEYGGVRLWDVRSGELGLILCGHRGEVHCVAYSPNGTQLASGGQDGTVRLWEVERGELGLTLRGHERGAVMSVAYSSSGSQLASGGSDETVWLWDVKTGEMCSILRGHTDWIYSIAYSPNGMQLVSGGGEEVRLWNVERGESGLISRGHENGVNSVACSPNGTQLASGSNDWTVRLWDAQSGETGPILRGHKGAVCSVAYSPNGRQLASGSYDQTVRLWDLERGEAGPILRGHERGVSSIAYSPNGLQLASGGDDNTVRLWDAQTGEPGPILRGHKREVLSVAYSPNGTQLASGSGDNTVRLWDVETGGVGSILHGHACRVSSAAYSPSGSQLASGSWDKTIRLWDLKRGESDLILRGHTGYVSSVAYSPSGSQLASGNYDNTVRLWEISSGQCLRIIQSFIGKVQSVVWQQRVEGEYVWTGSADKLVRKWEVKKEGEGYKARLDWMSGHAGLIVGDVLIEGVIGLSEVQHRLLNPSGARPPKNASGWLDFFRRNVG